MNESVDFQDGLQQLKDVKNQFASALKDFQKYYVYYHKNPEVSEFQNFYSNVKSQLQQLTKQVRTIEMDAQQKLQLLSQIMSKREIEIHSEKEKSNHYRYKLSQLENAKNGANMLINDTEQLYLQQYYRNIEMLVGLVLVASLIVKKFINGT